MLLFTRRIFTRLTRREYKTNSEALIGYRFKIGKQERENVIYHKITDVEWKIVNATGEKITENDIVEIVKIQGNKLVVKKIGRSKR